ncbi:hypothetical protein CAC42_6855 [Sphaceloma murrayae]|uniref:GST N-terminal domain-containing protein n=1 Tax=Sphaceloma murrayae TaxID=2082308 RepID=A0A2K1QHH1_9PEZI|nr:hypothetical protein CAC42_6855 [Sphaceloma murrayae]
MLNTKSVVSLQRDTPARPVLIVTATSYETWLKIWILLTKLDVQYDLVVLDGLKQQKSVWFQTIHPQQYVPALIDVENGQRIVLWDSTSIMMHLCRKYDVHRTLLGEEGINEAEVLNWTMFHAANFF